jgi:signal transduction histidine kinase
MRRRILGVAITAAVVAIALFAFPLAIAVHQLYLTNEQGELERAALRAVAAGEPAFASGDPIELPHTEADLSVAFFGTDGRRVAGSGPATADSSVARALTGQVVQGDVAGSLVEVVPVSEGERVIGAVRAATPVANVWRRTALTWAAMLALALAAVAVAVVVARRQARHLSSPLESLADVARTLGEGDFSVRTTTSLVPEIDQTGEALNATAARLGQLVERERSFSANASHQLRTPLTGLRLGLETALDGTHAQLRDAAEDAIASADELEGTIEELLRLARGSDRVRGATATTAAALEALFAEVVQRWHVPLLSSGRPLRFSVEPGTPTTSCSQAAIRQILDVLLDNALRHGSGAVDLVARDSGSAVAIDVRDEGTHLSTTGNIFERGYSTGEGHGIGLALARDLAQVRGGRLVLARTVPLTVFTLLLPATVEEGGVS